MHATILYEYSKVWTFLIYYIAVSFKNINPYFIIHLCLIFLCFILSATSYLNPQICTLFLPNISMLRLVHFDGETLWQGENDSTNITLLRNIKDIEVSCCYRCCVGCLLTTPAACFCLFCCC